MSVTSQEAVIAAGVMCGGLALAGEPTVRVETGAARAGITAPSWDTEGTGREKHNLLRPGTAAGLRFRVDGDGLVEAARESEKGGAGGSWQEE